MYTVPSHNPSSKEKKTISVPASLRDSLSLLNIVWSDMFETGDINPEEARKQEADFLKGAPPKWLNLVEEENLVKRNGFNDLIQLIERKKLNHRLVTDVSLQYCPGSGGSSLAMQVLWHFRKDLRCARVIDSKLDTKELSKQVVDLFLLSSEEHEKQNGKTVLLLLDIKENMCNALRKDLNEEIHKRDMNTDTPVAIILNCFPTDFTLNDTMVLPPKLSEGEMKKFKEKLLQQIRLQRKGHWKVTTINLLHHEDSGGSALAREVLSDLREEFTCETLTETFKTVTVENIANALLVKYEMHKKPVLLLLDHKDDKPSSLKNLLSKLQRADHTGHPAFIIINAVSKSAVPPNNDVKLKMELLPDEKEMFAQKRLEIEQKKMSHNYHVFNIMQGGFKKEDAERLITEEMIKHVKNHNESSSTRLLSFLALINSYVPGSHLVKRFCQEFMDQTKQPTDEGNPTLEMRMKPFMDLIVIFSKREQKGKRIRLAHPMIADACLKMFNEHKLTRSDIALDFLNSLVKGKQSNYEKICRIMLSARPEGLMEKQLFSRLILDIIRENNANQCIRLLKLASDLFDTNPYYPRTLARLYYIEVKEDNKYEEARKWAEEAIKREPKKSDIKDTLGQVHKSHLSWIWEESVKQWSKVENPWTGKQVCLPIAQSAIKAFKDEEEAAEHDSEENTPFNNKGLLGFLQVCKIIHPKTPLEDSDQEYRDFISGLKGDVETKYDFFEWFLAFSRPSIEKDNPDYIRKDVEECYKLYFTQREQTKETTLNEKKMKSFGGLLHFLKSDISVLKENQSALKNPQSEHEMVLYILANIILSQSGEPCEKAEDLQAKLQELRATEAEDRSPEFYLLMLLLFWPDEAQPAIANPPDLEKCHKKMNQSYKSKYQKYLRGRYLVPLFFLGKGKGLQRLVHTSKLQTDLKRLAEALEKAEVDCLQRISGKVEDHKVFAVIEGQQIQVTPHIRASVCKPGLVSFYLGFNIRGPVAYNIIYE